MQKQLTTEELRDKFQQRWWGYSAFSFGTESGHQLDFTHSDKNVGFKNEIVNAMFLSYVMGVKIADQTSV